MPYSSLRQRERRAFVLLYAGSIVLFFSAWHGAVLHAVPVGAVATFILIAAVSFAYGRVLIGSTALARAGHLSLTLEFLGGYLAFNTILFALELISPLGVPADIAIASLGALVLWLVIGRSHSPLDAHSELPSLAALVLCALATTFWCGDAWTPLVRNGSTTIVQLWGDSFVHARHISAFANGHGAASMSDIRMWGAPLYLYHYASYAIPAAVSAMTRSGAYEIFASFLLPVGVLLTGLAAFAFGGSVFGRWPAVAASLALLLVPDAYQQGFGNKYLSYNFMQQVNVGWLYGVACMSLAWIFVLHGCRARSVASIIIGWAIAWISLPYKAHVFVANAFLIAIYPCLFLEGFKLRWRIASAVALVAVFVLAVEFSQSIDRVPTLRLDGSGARTYIAYLLANQDPGLLKSLIERGLGDAPWTGPRMAMLGAMLILLGTFGWWSLIAIATAVWIRKSVPAAIWAFPLLVMANYLIMALGLAMDEKAIGAPDELINRPLVWAYFAIVAWTGGALYHRLLGEGLPRATLARAGLGVVALLGFAVPLSLASNLQTYPRWAAFASFIRLPTCLVDAARFVRDHSAPSDVVQDSENDFRFTGLAERPIFAMGVSPGPPGLDRRLEDLDAFRRMSSPGEIKAFAARNHIDWYVLRPTTELAWPAAIRDEALFECEGYRVFHFTR